MSANSIQTALQSLPETTQSALAKLAVLQEGGNLVVISHVAQAESVEAAKSMMDAVVAAGLAEAHDHTYYRFAPELLAHLVLDVEAAQQEESQQHWLAAVDQLLAFLYQQYFEDEAMALRLAALERANLMAYLEYRAMPPVLMSDNASQVVELLRRMETLLEKADAEAAQAQVKTWIATAESLQGEWSHVRFEHDRQNVENLFRMRALHPASQAAQALLQRCHTAGSDAYPGAINDLALANILMGQVLKAGQAGEQALGCLQEAQALLTPHAKTDKAAANLLIGCLMEQGDCLIEQGQLVPAEVLYSQCIEQAESFGDLRGSAIAQTQRASIYSMMERPADALRGYQSALEVFERLDDEIMMANVWQHIAMLHKVNQAMDDAKQAFTASLVLLESQGNTRGMISTLLELGNLSEATAELVTAIDYYHQALQVAKDADDKFLQSVVGNRLADALRKQGDFELALAELETAGTLGQAFGHAAEPWKSWNTLSLIETAQNNPVAAQAAKQRAIEAYVSYRVDGGENMERDGQLCTAVQNAAQQQRDGELRKVLLQLKEDLGWQDEQDQALLEVLAQLLNGERGLPILDNKKLGYRYAAELMLLQDRLPESH